MGSPQQKGGASQTPLQANRGLFGRFAVTRNMTETEGLLVNVLVDLKANPKQKRDGSTPEIKGFQNASKGLLTYIATPSPTVLGDAFTFVEVKRGRGDPEDFKTFLDQLIKGVAGKDALGSSPP